MSEVNYNLWHLEGEVKDLARELKRIKQQMSEFLNSEYIIDGASKSTSTAVQYKCLIEWSEKEI